MHIGERIKLIRKEKGLTQEALAKKCELATITVRQYELGKREPSLSQLAKIAIALGVSTSDLMEARTFASGAEFDAEWRRLTQNTTDPGIEIQHKADGSKIVIDHRKEKLDGIYHQLDDPDQLQFIKYGEFLLNDPKYKDKPPQD